MSASTFRNQAEHRVLTGFYAHLIAYLAVCGGLAVTNLSKRPHKPWFRRVAGGWGLGLLLHAVAAHVPRIRERKVDRVTERLRRRAERREGREEVAAG